MRKILFFVTLLAVLLMSCNSLQEIISGESGNVESVSATDEEMNAAIQKAQDTLPLFIQAFQSPKASQTGFSLKVKFPYGDNNEAEHMWVSGLSYSDNKFDGTLGNEPIYVKNIHLGDHIVVKQEDISDWMIIDNNKLLGGFTIHVLRNKMTTTERKQFDAEIGYTIPDEPALP